MEGEWEKKTKGGVFSRECSDSVGSKLEASSTNPQASSLYIYTAPDCLCFINHRPFSFFFSSFFLS